MRNGYYLIARKGFYPITSNLHHTNETIAQLVALRLCLFPSATSKMGRQKNIS